MAEFLWFLSGLLIGGCMVSVILCCIQVNRRNEYEQELRRLHKELNNK